MQRKYLDNLLKLLKKYSNQSVMNSLNKKHSGLIGLQDGLPMIMSKSLMEMKSTLIEEENKEYNKQLKFTVLKTVFCI